MRSIQVILLATAMTMSSALAQSVTNAFQPSNEYQAIPMVHVPSECTDGTAPGMDTVIYEFPYDFNTVVEIIKDFGNLTWSGNPPETVALNGTDNMPGTARQYSLQGIDVIETLFHYTNPFINVFPFTNFAYEEVHTTAQIWFGNITAYMPYDGERLEPMCGGRAARLNMTTHFCSNEPDFAAGLLHQLHGADAATINSFLGGEEFQGCDKLSWLPALPSVGGLPGLPSVPSTPPAYGSHHRHRRGSGRRRR